MCVSDQCSEDVLASAITQTHIEIGSLSVHFHFTCPVAPHNASFLPPCPLGDASESARPETAVLAILPLFSSVRMLFYSSVTLPAASGPIHYGFSISARVFLSMTCLPLPSTSTTAGEHKSASSDKRNATLFKCFYLISHLTERCQKRALQFVDSSDELYCLHKKCTTMRICSKAFQCSLAGHSASGVNVLFDD